MKVTIDGKEYDVRHSFSAGRALINYDGVTVFADANPDGTWDLSGEPARDGEEKQVLAAILAPDMDKTIVTVTPPEE